ncbi:MAG: DUF4362 domain-containing protein [Oscillospiraceae bacterium]|jgi:beta-lactamase regulating signal transducer with metallopeptidase domain|nr:DUF4362 domain-containing protein [Oscillospiraceae bacterium]
MSKIFLAVLNMSLTGAFVIAAVALARVPLKKAPKIISYALWAVAGFRLVVPFTLKSVLSLLPFKAAPIPQNIASQPIPRIDSGIPVLNNAVSAMLPAATPEMSVNPLQAWITAGSIIWLVGIAALLVYCVVSIVLLKRRLRGARCVEGNLYEADDLKTPFVLGFLRPRIYIPSGLSGEERRYVILHERTHIRRHDHIVKIFAYFVLCLHWFNPLAWAAFLLMGADMEMSCDERVLKELGYGTKREYSMSLLSLSTDRRIINGSPLAFGEGGMKERVKNILKLQKRSRIIIIAAVVLAVALSVGFALNRKDKPAAPRVFYLETYEQDWFSKVSRITLNADGTAEVEFPPHGARLYILRGATYEQTGDTLTIYEAVAENDTRVFAAFTVADGGDALVVVDSSAETLIVAGTRFKQLKTPTDTQVASRAYYIVNYADNKFAKLSHVTLNSDGTAALGTPYISSYIVLNPTYTITVDTLTLYETDIVAATPSRREIATFTIADDGETLIFVSTSVPLFADNGARYVRSETPPELPTEPEYTSSITRIGYSDAAGQYFVLRADNAMAMSISSVQHIPLIHFDDAFALTEFVRDFSAQVVGGALDDIDIFAQYGDAFFADNTLLVLYIEEASGSNRQLIRDVTIMNGLLTVRVDRITPNIGTDDMAAWIVLIEVPKEYTRDVESYDAYFALPEFIPELGIPTPLDQLPREYSAEQAIADGVYFDVWGQATNIERLNRFISGAASFVRVTQTTTEGGLIITDFSRDGSIFTVVRDDTRDGFSANRSITKSSYKYLVRYTPSADGGYFANKSLYALSNTPTITDADWRNNDYYGGTGGDVIFGYLVPILPSPSETAVFSPLLTWGEVYLNGTKVDVSDTFAYTKDDGELCAYFARDELIAALENAGYAEYARNLRAADPPTGYFETINGKDYIAEYQIIQFGGQPKNFNVEIGWYLSSHTPIRFTMTDEPINN